MNHDSSDGHLEMGSGLLRNHFFGSWRGVVESDPVQARNLVVVDFLSDNHGWLSSLVVADQIQ